MSVVNPLRIKAHLRTDLRRNKSDRADAFAIAKFGGEKNPDRWEPLGPVVAELQQLRALDDALVKQISSYTNRLHAMKHSELASEFAMDSSRRLKRYLEIEQGVVRAQMAALAKSICPREMEIMESVPGIGTHTVTLRRTTSPHTRDQVVG